jgi:hypothetical protein
MAQTKKQVRRNKRENRAIHQRAKTVQKCRITQITQIKCKVIVEKSSGITTRINRFIVYTKYQS